MASVVPSASRVAANKNVLIIGQSLGLQKTQTGCWAEFCNTVQALSSPTVNSVLAIQRALSGRTSARSIAVADGKTGPNDFLWDDIDGVPGPLISDSIPYLTALPSPVDAVIYNQGEADTNGLSGLNMTPSVAWTARTTAITNIISYLRTELSLPTLPVWIDMPPSSGISRSRAYARRRECDLSIINAGTNLYRGVEQYDVSRRDSTHLGGQGARECGRRAGHQLAGQLWGATTWYQGPIVASVTKISGTRTDVAITVESGDVLVKPTLVPQIWRLESDSAYGTALTISALVWSGNTAQLTHSTCAGNPVFFSAYDDCITFDVNRYVYGSVSLMPLRSMRLGWSTAN